MVLITGWSLNDWEVEPRHDTGGGGGGGGGGGEGGEVEMRKVEGSEGGGKRRMKRV